MVEKGSLCVVATRRGGIRQADCRRVITRPFIPSEERVRNIINRVLNLAEDQVEMLLGQVMEEFSYRHRRFEQLLERNFQTVAPYLPGGVSLSENRKLLIGAYFTSEYSIQSVGVLNPSIALHPDQSGLKIGEVRYLITFRCVGEGHISSLEFRSCIFDAACNIKTRPISPFVETPELLAPNHYEKSHFIAKLKQRGVYSKALARFLQELPPEFTAADLEARLREGEGQRTLPKRAQSEMRTILQWMDKNVYRVRFAPDTRISGRVLFPVLENEREGIEDVRLVRFTDDDGEVTYYATYTGYSGHAIVSKLLETRDFLYFKSTTLTGKATHNKGLALFPRRIRGKYAMLARLDNENNYVAFSDDIYHWDRAEPIQGPSYPWEFVQIGNCGSPIETEAGWLVLTHGVGAMRKYCIGVALLDLDNPAKLIGRLEEPILCPNEYEREGYVPNVVYSCGAVIHHDKLIITYAMSDWESGIATVPVKELLANCLAWQAKKKRKGG
jgi:predicted GH43/DUF377 family glycosyl hydrolase